MGILQGGCSLSKHTVGSQQMCRQSKCVSPRMCTCACLYGNTLGTGISPGMNINSPLVYVSYVCVSICVYMSVCTGMCIYVCLCMSGEGMYVYAYVWMYVYM